MNAYSREQIDIFRSIFKGRHDAYGAGDGVCIKEPLSDEVLQGHFNGIRRIGLYPLSPEILDGKGTYWIVADADDKENDRLAEAIALKEILAQRGIDSHIERSKSKGYHIWVFLSAPIEATKAREAMRSALDALEKDTGYKIKEIFPKQEFIDPNDINNFGNYINLPMFGRDLVNGKTALLDPANDYKPCSNPWDFIKNIAKVKPDQLERPIKQDEASTDESGKTPRKGESKYPCFKEMIKGVDKGCRNNVAFALSMQLRVGESSQKATSALLKDVWNPLNRPPLETSEIDKIIDDVYRAKNGRGYYGIGCNQIEEFCGKETCIIYKKQVSQKFAKNNRYFNNGTFIPKLLADELMEEFPFMNVAEKIHVYREGVYVPEGKHLIEFEAQRRLGDATYDYRIKEVIVYIEREKYIKPDETMDNAEVINLKNGLLNWREGTLSPHSPEYKSIIQIPVEYDPEATCPKIDNFLETTLPSDYTPLIEELLGYFLIPDTKMEKAVMLLGAGSNGKSTLTRLIGAFIGDENVAKIPLQDLSPDNRFSVAGLYGKLLNVFSDIDSKALERSSFFKAIVSGDTIKAEQKHKDHFTLLLMRGCCSHAMSFLDVLIAPTRIIGDG